MLCIIRVMYKIQRAKIIHNYSVLLTCSHRRRHRRVPYKRFYFIIFNYTIADVSRNEFLNVYYSRVYIIYMLLLHYEQRMTYACKHIRLQIIIIIVVYAINRQ